MKITYYLPDESDTPMPPEGFTIIGYRTGLIESVETNRLESYRFGVLPLRCLEDNYQFECVATDENTEIFCRADIRTGKYASEWQYSDGYEVFDLAKYKEQT